MNSLIRACLLTILLFRSHPISHHLKSSLGERLPYQLTLLLLKRSHNCKTEAASLSQSRDLSVNSDFSSDISANDLSMEESYPPVLSDN